jgi:hypothetical protein
LRARQDGESRGLTVAHGDSGMHPDLRAHRSAGRGPKPSKLVMRVRFPSPALSIYLRYAIWPRRRPNTGHAPPTRRRPGSPPGTRSARNPHRRSSGRRRPREDRWGTDPANANGVGKPRGQGLNLGDLLGRETADNTSSVRDVLPRPIAHLVADSARRRISLISAAASRRALRSADSATMRSQSRSRAASMGQRSTATQVHQCSTKYLAGIRLYSSRARAVAAVQSDSNFASAAVSSLATAARSAAGSRSGSGTTGCPSSRVAVMASSVGRPGLMSES